MAVGQHIHIVDGKQVAYPNNACPICGTAPAQPEPARMIPNVHTKGITVVVQTTKLQMSTTTWYGKGNCFLHSIRRAQRDSAGKLMIGTDGRPLWNQLTIRMSVAIAKDYIRELSKLISDVEKPQTVPPTTVPQRA